MTTYYLDSSVALHILLDPRSRAARWFQRRIDDGDRFFSARLLQTEVVRTLRREDLPVELGMALLDDVGLLPLSEPVLAIAEGIRPHLRALDAIHLATALHTQRGPTVVTHDAAMAAVAGTLGLPVHDPVE